MEYKRKKLVVENDRVFADDGEYLFTVSMTEEARALLNDEGWKRGQESWVDYRNRTTYARIAEEKKRQTFLNELVTAYNDSIKEPDTTMELMKIRTLGTARYVYEVHEEEGFITWVSATDRKHAAVFPKENIKKKVEELKKLAGISLEAIEVMD